jgi:BirA family transcriptional regulator, biotin operon repressor / biotin---[acetyl-CoA-carboxylase] ligase
LEFSFYGCYTDVADEILYDGESASALAELLSVPHVEVRHAVGSTLDLAHELALAGAAAGTVVIADRQSAGRGRGGKSWQSATGAGVWLTIVERPKVENATGVIALRAGIAAAEVLDSLAPRPVSLKWPNDLYVGSGKLAGILVEARWRGGNPEWIALGMGVNLSAPDDFPHAGALSPGVSRIEVLAALVPALRGAARAYGELSAEELARFAQRDMAAGRRCIQPGEGTVLGITQAGELRVAADGGEEVRFRGGSLVLQEEQ